MAPDFKIIGDYCKDNGVAFVLVCGRCILLCRKMELFPHAVVVIDEGKLKVVYGREHTFTVGKVRARRELLEGIWPPCDGRCRTSLIIAHRMTNGNNDRALLSGIAAMARDAFGSEHMPALAGPGYFNLLPRRDDLAVGEFALAQRCSSWG